MRLRFAVLGSLLAAAVVVGTPSAVAAAPDQPVTPVPNHNRGLTINAIPNPIAAGEGAVIYGQLQGDSVGGQTISLYQRVNPSHQFTLAGKTTTLPGGYYEFQENSVYTNRSWFVSGPSGARSRIVHEQVQALVSLHANRAVTDTSQPITFFGHVTPSHAFDRVLLQAQVDSSDEWRTIDSGRLGPGSDYTIVHHFRIPGERTVRVVLPADARNITSTSDSLTVTIQQAQVPDFTINSSQPVIDLGQSATISGTLYMPGTKKPEPHTAVTLCGRPAGVAPFTCDNSTVTGADGSYSFTVRPNQNEVYVVRTTVNPHRRTAPLFEGVRDLVALFASPTDVTAGQPVTFIGFVLPTKPGDTVYLQRLGADGEYHTVATGKVAQNDVFQFTRVFGQPGPKTFRVRVLSDQQNVGGVSNSVTVNVTLPPPSQLPPSASS
jgi:hypothetical protein